MISRRKFIQMLSLFTIASYAEKLLAYEKKDRILNLYNTHTGERLNVRYCSCGIYDREAIDGINTLLRCHYTNEIKAISRGVLDLLCDIKDLVDTDAEIQIISGYRSPAYNNYLWSIGRGVVKDSLHMQGRAIDFYLPHIHNRKLFTLAKSFYAGGVGHYPDFVHIDNGRVRYW